VAVGSIQTEADLARFIDQRLGPLQRMRDVYGLIVPVTGVPVDPPAVARAIAIRLDGGVGSTLYVWRGSAWAAVA
jgi:hypothetical protein